MIGAVHFSCCKLVERRNLLRLMLNRMRESGIGLCKISS
jgi:hypothetical protein